MYPEKHKCSLIEILHSLWLACRYGRCTALLALDISAAFDAVNHRILCQRLQHSFGVNGSALDWLRSFMSGHSQYVAAGGERSDTVPCESSVPQGLVLGPLLFSLYVAPVSDCAAAHHVSIHQYMPMAFRCTLPSNHSVSVVCLSWSPAPTTSPAGSLKMVFCWTHLRPRQWYSEPHPDWEVLTSLEVSRWLASAFSFQEKVKLIGVAQSSTKHLRWIDMYPASSVPEFPHACTPHPSTSDIRCCQICCS